MTEERAKESEEASHLTDHRADQRDATSDPFDRAEISSRESQHPAVQGDPGGDHRTKGVVQPSQHPSSPDLAVVDSGDEAVSQGDQPSSKEREERTPQQRHRRYNLRVTDFRDQAWCEQQLAFTLVEGREETEAMKAGSERHQALHEEITELIEVEPTTREDMWGLHMWNAWAGLQLLRHTGLGREIPVFGQVPGHGAWVVGIIDELKALDDHHIQLLDTKTRRRPSLPRIEQKYTTRVQMALYWRLFAQLAHGDFDQEAFYKDLRLDPALPFSTTMREEMQAQGMAPENLGSFLPMVLEAFATAPTLHPQLVVRYEWQEDQSLLGTDQFRYREDLLMERIYTFMEYWQGQRPPHIVPPRERWKCRFCQFQTQCPAFGG